MGDIQKQETAEQINIEADAAESYAAEPDATESYAVATDAAESYAAEPGEAAHIFVINPASFMRRADADALVKAIEAVFEKRAGWRRHIHISRYPRDAIGAVDRIARSLPDQTPLRVYAVGGDGILFDCLNAVMSFRNVGLTAVPYGHENGFIRAFGDGAENVFCDLDALVAAPSIPTDVIFCDGNYALNCCMIGFEAVANLWESRLLRRFSSLRNINLTNNRSVFYMTATIGVIGGGFKNQRYSVTADGERLDGEYTTVHVANGPCYGNFLTPTAGSLPDDGSLELILGRMRSAFSIVRRLSDISNGRYDNIKRRCKDIFIQRLIKELEISSDEPMIANLDGEVFYESSFKIKVMPGAVRIIAPAGMRYRRAEQQRRN